MTSRAALAAPLLLQAPPGQLPNVYEDLTGLVGSEGDDARGDEDEFKRLASNVREEHNLEQHIIVDLPNGRGRSILCPSAAHNGQSNRFLAPKYQISFAVDHETLATSDEKPYKPNASVEELRSLLEKSLSVYVEDRYSSGLADVFAVSLPRVQVPIKEAVLEEAKDVSREIDPSVETGSVSATANDRTDDAEEEKIKEDQMKVDDEADETEEKDKEENHGEEESDQTAAMEDVQDDPVTAAEAMEEVEEQKKEPPATTIAAEEEDTETEGETKLVIQIVANRYKLSNFWSGRWRATYVLSSPSATEISGDIKVQIHYFEEGNVQLNSSKSEELVVSSETSNDAKAKALVGAIEKFETSYQEELFNTCNELSEGAFKSLRRQLPMTKQKVDWDKVLNYKLGSELTE